MLIREAVDKDPDQILDLFENTVKKINSGDYAPEQIAVWAASKNKRNLAYQNH